MNKKREILTPIGPSIAYVPLTRGLHALIDSDQSRTIGLYSWSATPGRRNGFYAVAYVEGKVSKLHRVIVHPDPHLQVDHVNGNGLDNRATNLRIATNAENNRNKAKLSANTSGMKGIRFHEKTGTWRARIKVNYQERHLGVYKTAEEAHEAYRRAANEYHGEFARME